MLINPLITNGKLFRIDERRLAFHFIGREFEIYLPEFQTKTEQRYGPQKSRNQSKYQKLLKGK